MDALASNLVVYSVQVAVLVGIAGLAAALTPAAAATRLAYWQAALMAALLVALPGATGVAPPGPAAVEAVGVASAAAVARPASGGWTWGDGLVVVWLAGALTRLGWLALGLLALARLRRHEAPAVEGAPGDVRWHPTIGQPVSFGWVRPVILLPERLRALSVEARNAVIAHETRHVARGDWTRHVAEEVVRAVLWFHPAIWWAVDRIRLHREQVVDHEVAAALPDRRPYMEALLAMADAPATRVPAPGFGARRHLPARLRALAALPRVAPHQGVARGALIVALAVAAAAACALPWQARVYSPDDPGVTLPIRINNVQPYYSPPAQEAGIQGVVRLTGIVNTAGVIEDLRVTESLDTRYGLDEQARLAVSQWRFEPGTRNGEPVPVELEFLIRFTLT
jgi:TonB family protein